MEKIWIIAKKELNSFFDSLMAYILLVVFLGFSGFFTWLYMADVFFVNQAGLQTFFGVAKWTLFFFIPAITMGLIAEENRAGTIELLLTKPVTDWQVVFGKFLSTLILIVIALLLTIPYYITVSNLGNIDHGAVLSGYLALILMSAAYISIGIFASSVSSNQIVGFILALFIGILFHWIFDLLGNSLSGTIGKILSYLSVSDHFDSISRGVLDTKDIIYFLSLIFFGLFLTETSLAKRNVVN